jgi:hypothetical protein
MSRVLTKPARRAATYEDLLAVPEPLVAEILFGERRKPGPCDRGRERPWSRRGSGSEPA